MCMCVTSGGEDSSTSDFVMKYYSFSTWGKIHITGTLL